MNIPQLKQLIFVYYGLSVLLLTVIGVGGFPHALSEPFGLTVFGILWPFLVAVGLRMRFQSVVVGKAHIFEQPKLQFFFDFGLFVLIGVLLFLYQYFYHQVHILLAVKLCLCVISVGYFASMDLALARERSGFESPNPIYRHEFSAGSLTHRLSLFLTIAVVIALVAVTMEGYSYLTLLNVSEKTGEEFLKSFLAHVFFILLVVVSLIIRLIHAYSENLRRFFDIQLAVLRFVEGGDYRNYVPIVSRDEFGLIAQQTNKMIDELRDKEHIETTLGQVVSPSVMNKLLTKESAPVEKSQQRNVAILFCDIRRFTTYAENTPPEEVLLFLNAYFTKMADLVSEHSGVVNKFIGDAILAVFDYEDCENPSEDAFAAALDIVEHSQAIVLSDDRTINVGVGIHFGPVAAGILGSADRYEYTYIGDAVNTASRLEGLSKRLGHKIIVSSDAWESLSSQSQSKLVDLGEQRVRGKSEPVHIYAASVDE